MTAPRPIQVWDGGLYWGFPNVGHEERTICSVGVLAFSSAASFSSLFIFLKPG